MRTFILALAFLTITVLAGVATDTFATSPEAQPTETEVAEETADGNDAVAISLDPAAIAAEEQAARHEVWLQSSRFVEEQILLAMLTFSENKKKDEMVALTALYNQLGSSRQATTELVTLLDKKNWDGCKALVRLVMGMPVGPNYSPAIRSTAQVKSVFYQTILKSEKRHVRKAILGLYISIFPRETMLLVEEAAVNQLVNALERKRDEVTEAVLPILITVVENSQEETALDFSPDTPTPDTFEQPVATKSMLSEK